MRWLLTVSVVLSLTAQVLSTGNFCDRTIFCVSGFTGSNNNVFITIHSASRGYVGFGVGSSMARSIMYLAWRNSTGGIVLSSRQSTGHTAPRPSQEQTAVLVPTPPGIITPPWATLSFTFRRPATSRIMSITAGSTYIHAYSHRRPTNLNSPSAVPGMHDSYGRIPRLDLTGRMTSSISRAGAGGNTGLGGGPGGGPGGGLGGGLGGGPGGALGAGAGGALGAGAGGALGGALGAGAGAGGGLGGALGAGPNGAPGAGPGGALGAGPGGLPGAGAGGLPDAVPGASTGGLPDAVPGGGTPSDSSAKSNISSKTKERSSGVSSQLFTFNTLGGMLLMPISLLATTWLMY
ncbi:hypothetical protein BASA50_001171 [Batrachochytrium salamandrivorans]|uniref:DOMON domain-containing protein n=1 Tax=Batrachochytrium salamandrivorans TaxID=1357716 RepID=A0ABQ8ERU0_9FUNG|nr:hypothetical protein BASA60_008843 [Batrachochytrium salamandrivorans]KAH6578074.1 hypothetical protein BASA62_000514 [Batrachochytrium salamandrivorans]KAH6579158.1 hypothetical protein BASA61_010460 [Batrachochytrium salamandrivorans]KAH6585562.1 hypothetical protein BASA50_001171 [Batrachochytrium salamandrivorans]KAH9248856.1 hypothetical protein BASA81_013466 [Batrachochytrium salamandrivorans]